MANKRLQEMAAAGSLNSTDLLYIEQGSAAGAEKKLALSALQAHLLGALEVATAAQTIYADSVGGSDANSGASETLAKKTLAAAVAVLNEGDTLLLRGESRFFEPLAGMPAYVTIDRYGYGEQPIVDQSREIPAGSWIAHATIAGVWYADVTHQNATSNPGAGDANACWFQMWSEWTTTREPECLQPYWAGADIAANVAYAKANPGLFTCHKQGSTQKNPQADGNSTLYRYFVYPPNGENPSTGGIKYFYAEQIHIADLETGCIARNMIWQRNAHKDGSGHNQNNCDRLEYITIRDVPIHAWVGGATLIRKCYAKASPVRGSHVGAGGGWHTFGGATNYGTRLEDCEADGFGANIYGHEPGPGGVSTRRVAVRNFVSRNGSAAIEVGGDITFGFDIDGLKSINDKGFMTLPQGSVVRNVSFLSAEGSQNSHAFGYRGVTGGRIDVENASIVFRNTGSKTLVRNEIASETANAAHVCTVSFNRLTNIGGNATGSAYLSQVHYRFTDSVVGYLTAGLAAAPWLSLVADNSQIGMWTRTLAEIQALAPGVNSNCVTPWTAQPYARTVDEADLAYAAISLRAVSGTNGNDTLTASSQDFAVVGGQIKVLDANGSGGVFITRVTEVLSTGPSGQFKVSPSPSVTFTDKAVQRAFWSRKLFPQGVTGLTAVFSDDGTQAYFSEASPLVAQGMTVYFGALGRRDPIGARKIVSLSGRTATLDRPVVWQTAPNGTYLTYAAFGTGLGAPRPSVPVAFEFPLRAAQSGVTGWGTQYANDYALPVAAATRTGEEGTGTGGYARFTNNAVDLFTSGAEGLAGQINHQLGEIDAAFNPIGAGDVLSVNAVAYVEDYDALFEGVPEQSGIALLRRGSAAAERRIGALVAAL